MPKRVNEVEAKDRFVKFLSEHYGQGYSVAREDVVGDSPSQRNYDYELAPTSPDLPVIALELSRLFGDEEDIKHNSAWADMTQRLQAELEARGIIGYVIRTPRFNIPKCRRDQFASETAQQLAWAIDSSQNKSEIKIEGFVIHKMPGFKSISFSYIGGIRQLNPLKSAGEALDSLLPIKSDQLNTQGRLRVLLIVNSDPFQGEESVRQYFATANAEEFPNIDRVFFEVTPSNFCLVFDRRAFDCYCKEELPDENELAILFVSIVERRLSSDHKKAFKIVKKISNRNGSLDRLSVDGKEALISSGERFSEEGSWTDVMWIIEHLKDDADPPFPNTMHDKLARGEDYLPITSVRGRLCWLMHKVIVHNVAEYYATLMDIFETYAVGPDFYIRSQVCVPLTEIARRRRSLLPDGRLFMHENLSSRVKDLAFRALRNAEGVATVLDYISGVFQWIRDLSAPEAREVVDRLSKVSGLTGVHNRCALLLYFALFREGDFKDLPPFHPSSFREQMRQELESGESRFRSSLMWLAAAEAERGTLPYEVWNPFLKSFLSGPYDRGAFLHLQRVCLAYIKTYPEELCPLVLSAMHKVAAQTNSGPESAVWKIFQLNEYVEMLADTCEESRVLDAVEILLGQLADPPLVTLTKAPLILDRYQSARARKLKSEFATKYGEK